MVSEMVSHSLRLHSLCLTDTLSPDIVSLADGYFNLVLVIAQLAFLTIPLFVYTYAMVVVRASTWSYAKLNAASTTTILTAVDTGLNVL